jgi:hypothetical protein
MSFTLQFRREYVLPILNGRKRATLRRSVATPPELGTELRFRNGYRAGSLFATATLVEVRTKLRVPRDMTAEVAGLDGFESARALREALRMTYPGVRVVDQLVWKDVRLHGSFIPPRAS